MCGRYAFYSPAEAVRNFFSAECDIDLRPRYNITPTQDVPVVRQAAGHRKADLLHWGLIPFWAKEKAIGNRMINARAETIAQKPSFRQAFKSRRCLVLADGFYEWKSIAGSKQPFYISMTDRTPMAFAGLWERWDKQDPPIESCTIVTTEANKLLSPVHHRMPVILDTSMQDQWLSEDSDDKRLATLLGPHEFDKLGFYPVSRKVNSPANQGEDLIECVPEPASSGQST